MTTSFVHEERLLLELRLVYSPVFTDVSKSSLMSWKLVSLYACPTSRFVHVFLSAVVMTTGRSLCAAVYRPARLGPLPPVPQVCLYANDRRLQNTFIIINTQLINRRRKWMSLQLFVWSWATLLHSMEVCLGLCLQLLSYLLTGENAVVQMYLLTIALLSVNKSAVRRRKSNINSDDHCRNPYVIFSRKILYNISPEVPPNKAVYSVINSQGYNPQQPTDRKLLTVNVTKNLGKLPWRNMQRWYYILGTILTHFSFADFVQ